MKEIHRTNNPVEIHFIVHKLNELGIQAFEFDQHTSVVEGSIGAIQRRIMVVDDEYDAAVSALKELDI